MSWSHYDLTRPLKEELRRLWTWENEHRAVRALDVALKLNTAYLAIEVTDKATGDRRVTAEVALIRHHPARGNAFFPQIALKPMSENAGPHASECPPRILERLTETDSEIAQNWRRRCWDNHQRRQLSPGLRAGTLLFHERGLRFQGRPCHWFYVPKARSKRSVVAILDQGGIRGRFPRNALLECEAVMPPTVQQLDPAEAEAGLREVRVEDPGLGDRAFLFTLPAVPGEGEAPAPTLLAAGTPEAVRAWCEARKTEAGAALEGASALEDSLAP